MAFSYGFFNSISGDRKYDAEQMSAIFDGLITDGVFYDIGNRMVVIAGSGLQVIVQTGKAWFFHTWSVLDANLPLAIGAADPSLKRIDAIVLEVNHNTSVRANSIKVVRGVNAASPVKPTLTNNDKVKQLPLAYVTVNAGATSITQANIENCVGLSACPYVTGVVASINADNLYAQWDAEFREWFANLKAMLNDNVVANLQWQIDNLNERVTSNEQIVDLVSKIVIGSPPSSAPSKVFTSNGSLTATDVGTATNIGVLCIGGGGGGGGGSGIGGGGGGGCRPSSGTGSGGGGGGGSGSSASGGGGGSGYMNYFIFEKSALTFPISISIGSGGAGGSGGSYGSSGAPGQNRGDSGSSGGTSSGGTGSTGGISSFGNYLSASGGTGGTGGKSYGGGGGRPTSGGFGGSSTRGTGGSGYNSGKPGSEGNTGSTGKYSSTSSWNDGGIGGTPNTSSTGGAGGEAYREGYGSGGKGGNALTVSGASGGNGGTTANSENNAPDEGKTVKTSGITGTAGTKGCVMVWYF